MFATNFLPTPDQWQGFKKFLQLKYIGKSPAIMSQHLDAYDKVRYGMKKSGFTPEDEDIWIQNAMGFPGWGELYASPDALLEAIETWMDSVENAV